MRTTVQMFRSSRIPQVLGTCMSDLPSCLSFLNEATQRLLSSPAVGDEGWFGSYAKVVFNVDPNFPYITVPREIARLEWIDVCNHSIKVQNQFLEFLDFGIGLQKQCANSNCCKTGILALDRGIVPTQVDMPTGSKLRVYWTNAADNEANLVFEGTDSNDMEIYTVFNGQQVTGVYLTIDTSVAFTDTSYTFNTLQNVAKDITLGPVNLYAVDSGGNQLLLQTFAPNQTSGSYRRYFLQNFPKNCNGCNPITGKIQVTAMAMLEFVPMTSDSDFLILGNLPALKEMCQSIRYEEMDIPNAKQQAEYHYKKAIGLLNGELTKYEGRRNPAVNFRPFGWDSLARQRVDMI